MLDTIKEVKNLKDIFTHRTLKNGINLFIHSTDKFKTNTFCIFIHQNLKKETATMTALLPFVLKRGTQSFPTSRHLSLYLENLYGADMGGDILKRGESQILQFFMETVNQKYVTGDDIIDSSLKAFKELVLNPVEEDGSFKQAYVEQEKDVLRRNIESLYNDKFNYAIERCFQEMCKDEAFSIYKYGNIEDLKTIDKNNLYEYYLDCLQYCPIDFFVLGDVNEDEISEKIEKLFDFARKGERLVKTSFVRKEIKNEKIVEERQDVNQGKLSMGFRTNTRYGDDDYYALMVYNGILGGGPHSKLFQNVREKASLAYYAFSKLEKNKGLMLIGCGIEFANFDRTVKIIKEQLEDIKAGKISDYEFDSTVKSLVNSFKESSDSPSMIISLYLDGIINGVRESTDDMIKKIQDVTKEDVKKVAQKISLDTIFFLNKK
jgi:predicted Zn-dependent peptidase